jgi:DNA (cytosine-5)-methyltransferase 1
MSMMNVIDLFSGAGGLSKGFENAGFNIVAGIDNDSQSLTTFSKNHFKSKTINFDLSQKIDFSSNLFSAINNLKVDVIIGGPPCQGFSVAGKRRELDPRNTLYKTYLSFIKHFNPKLMVIENVPTIMSMFNGRIYEDIVFELEKLGYTTSAFILDSSNYGVPQRRKRFFLMGTKSGKKIAEPKASSNEKITVKDALSDLPSLANIIESKTYSSNPKNKYQKRMRINSFKLHNHWKVIHTEKTKKIISLVPDGGNYKDLPHHLRNTRKVHIAWTRMNSKEPCFTIDAGHNHHFHYKYNRVPTVRECARIQSFSDDFIFYGTKTSQYRQVGNAVPPILAEVLAKKIKCELNGL